MSDGQAAQLSTPPGSRPGNELVDPVSHINISPPVFANAGNQDTLSTIGGAAADRVSSSVDGDAEKNISNSLVYLNAVKERFIGEDLGRASITRREEEGTARSESVPPKYKEFVAILTDFKDGKIGTSLVVQRVAVILEGHEDLISGFTIFLPPGYEKESKGTRE